MEFNRLNNDLQLLREDSLSRQIFEVVANNSPLNREDLFKRVQGDSVEIELRLKKLLDLFIFDPGFVPADALAGPFELTTRGIMLHKALATGSAI